MRRPAALASIVAVVVALGGVPGTRSAAVAGDTVGGDVDRALDQLQRRLREVERQVDGLGAAARARLEQERRALRRKLADIEARSATAWRRIRPELDRALDELHKALDDRRPDPELTRT
jgi:uncharacterized membrane protein YccC